MAEKKSDIVLVVIDLGASSGRVIVATIVDGKLQLKEFHRFENGPVENGGHWIWNLEALIGEILAGLKKVGAKYAESEVYITIDTWGVDGAFFKDGNMLAAPLCYRDSITADIMPQAFELVDKAEIYGRNGLQFMPFNTIFQWLAMKNAGLSRVTQADRWGFMPDILTQWLAGIKQSVVDYTIASTSGGLKVGTMEWDTALLTDLGIPTAFLPEVVKPGEVSWPLATHLANQTGLRNATVVLGAGHDTACAVAAVPADAITNWGYNSLGTWSLVGVEIPRPMATPEALACNITHEGAVDGRIRFLKNVAGTFPLQECRKAWNEGAGNASWATLTAWAEKANAFRCFTDPNDQRFSPPDSADNRMEERIRQFCRDTGQTTPIGKGQVARCIKESLCMAVVNATLDISKVTEVDLDVMHAVGGGIQDTQLCQWMANALGIPVIAGPIEATTIGNALVLAKAAGVIEDMAAGRELVRKSFSPERYEPQDLSKWTNAYKRYLAILEKSQGE